MQTQVLQPVRETQVKFSESLRRESNTLMGMSVIKTNEIVIEGHEGSISGVRCEGIAYNRLSLLDSSSAI